jgi:hypothetical protein
VKGVTEEAFPGTNFLTIINNGNSIDMTFNAPDNLDAGNSEEMYGTFIVRIKATIEETG